MTTKQNTEEVLGTPKVKVELTGKERKQVAERIKPTAMVVHETIRREGEHELLRPISSLAFSALAAGLSMGFSLVAEGLIRSALPDTPWRPLISKLGYSVGFLIVVLGRQQLFTENTLTPVLPLLTRRNLATLWRVLRLWAVVLAGNLAGALIFATVIGHSEIFKPEVKQTFLAIGFEAISAGFWTTLIRGIFAGWLVGLMVWLLPMAETSRVFIIVLLTYLIGIGSLAHIIAGSIEVLYVVTTGSAPWYTYVTGFFLPTLIGNMIGGGALVGILNHAQVAAEVDSSNNNDGGR